MEKIVLKAARREVTGKHVKVLRREGRLPAVMYGHKFAPISISLDAHEAQLTLPGLTSSTIVNIDLDGELHAALVREKQKDYIQNTLVHVDFQIVSLSEKLRAAVQIELRGVSPAVKDYNAVVVHSLTSVEVEALPQDLPEKFVIDISKLAQIGDSVLVRDLNSSDKVSILTPEDEVVVVATGAAAEEVETETAEGGSEPEVIERGKKEEED